MCRTDPSIEAVPQKEKTKRVLSTSMDCRKNRRLISPRQWPEDPKSTGCNWLIRQWQNWTFSYMNVVLTKGAKQNKQNGDHLTTNDLFPVPKLLESSHLLQAFFSSGTLFSTDTNSSAIHPAQEKNNMNGNKSKKTSSSSSGPSQTSSLVSILFWKVAAPTYIPAALCQLIAVLCGVAMPLLVREFLRVLEGDKLSNESDDNHNNTSTRGLPWAISICIVSIVNAFASHRQRHLALKSGISVRSTILNVLYGHILQLSPHGKHGLTTGEITNLVAVDAQKLYEVTQDGHLLWALPLIVLLVMICLIQILGVSAFVGITVLVGFVPVIERTSSKMLSIRTRRVKCTDQRVELVSTMLQGIQVTKLNHYEPLYMQQISDIRKQELVHLSRENAVWVTNLLVAVSSPVLATGVAFAVYVIIDENHILRAADTFGVLLLFAALRGPIFFTGRVVGKLAHALSALRRIRRFLDRPLHENKTIQVTALPEKNIGWKIRDNDNDNNHFPLRLTNAAFRVGTSSPSVSAVVPGEPPTNDQLVDESIKNQTDKGDDTTAGQTSSFSVAVDTKSNTPPPMATSMTANKYGDNSHDDSTDSNGFTVSEFSFSMAKGEVIAVCGPVGSGKSTLLNGILQEAEPVGPATTSNSVNNNSDTTEAVQISGNVSYAPQTPFILNQTVRENILFGIPYDEGRYQQVLHTCCLHADLEQLPDGDATEIGERGVTLSGGQKQRVSLARAAYAQSSLVLLDDPFSALDSGTGKTVFERLIVSASHSKRKCSTESSNRNDDVDLKNNDTVRDSGSTGEPLPLFNDSAILLVTHASHFITHQAVDKILLIVDGKNQFFGKWDDLINFRPRDENTRRAVEHIRSSIREEETSRDDSNNADDDNEDDKGSIAADEQEGQNTTGGGIGGTDSSPKIDEKKKEEKKKGPGTAKSLMQEEEREHGVSNMKTWLLWFDRAGGWSFILIQTLLLTIDRFAYVAVEWFLAQWTSAADGPVSILGKEFPAQTDGRSSAQARYLRVYFTIMAVSFFATFIRCEWAVTGGVRATRKVFDSMLKSVLRAPMSYFETVPMGRILNRFTYDTDVNDVTLTQAMSMFIISCSWYVAVLIVQATILPLSVLAILPVSAMYWKLMIYYRMSGPDLQRIDALTRSPVQSMVNECLEGNTSIRIFRQEATFLSRFRTCADVNSSALLNFVSAQRWMGVRMELLGSIVVLVTSVLVVTLDEGLDLEPGLVGLLIVWSSSFTFIMNFLVEDFAETEAAITAIERVDAMSYLPEEGALESSDEDNSPPRNWPEHGRLEFSNVSLRYRSGLPLALDNLSFTVPAGKTCGIVGRTGAGKSSIAVALFRLVEIEGGNIYLDGIDLGLLGLSDVRGRGMSIIPQDPFLAGSNLRECLDPFSKHSDDEIVKALQAVRLFENKQQEQRGRNEIHSQWDECDDADDSASSSITMKELLSHRLEEGGSNYSVGERQLLNLARALLSQPKVLILDEATASIDGETDEFIQKMIRTKFPYTTVLTIAHRLNTIMDYDYILVMDAGHAAEFGSPAELLSSASSLTSLDGDGNRTRGRGIFAQLVDATGPESSKSLRALAFESVISKEEKEKKEI